MSAIAVQKRGMDFDAPLFKILARNDTGQAAGHQGGMVIPAALDPYFPQLSRRVSALAPTQEEIITAELFVGSRYAGTVETRYQFQTWGGKRPPERRLTRNLGPLRDLAEGGDLLIIERGIQNDRHYRLRLVKQTDPRFGELWQPASHLRWGALEQGIEPVKEVQVDDAEQRLRAAEHRPFQMFDANAVEAEVRSVRIARSRAFQKHVAQLYELKCAVCRGGLVHPSGRSETEAAHIVPKRLRGSDDARNGMQLCRAHHWGFDEGLFMIDQQFRLQVPNSVSIIPENSGLAQLAGQEIFRPADQSLWPSLDALAWHQENVLIR
jgi:putative restriction endonuclease